MTNVVGSTEEDIRSLIQRSDFFNFTCESSYAQDDRYCI